MFDVVISSVQTMPTGYTTIFDWGEPQNMCDILANVCVCVRGGHYAR